MDHDWIVRFLERRIGNKRMLRLVRRWLTVGTMTDVGQVRLDRGAQQGAVISPLLANIYFHYAMDLWVQQWRQRTATGDVIVTRYADDIVLGLQHESDARQLLSDLQARLDKFGLNLHPKKTHLIRFGRFARRDCSLNGEGKPLAFDFLGFTHYCTVARVNRRFLVGRKSIKERMRSQFLEIKQVIRKRLNRPVGETGAWLRRVLRGHLNYCAAPGNQSSLRDFFIRVKRYGLFSLRRRNQRHRMTWVRFGTLWQRFAPPILLAHDYPAQRFDANTRGRSPVR